MKSSLRILLISLLTFGLSGCAGVFIAGGAAATANVIMDTRSSKELLDDNTIELEVTGLGNKAPFTGNARITASSHKGNVLLVGQAVDQQTKNTVTARVKEIKGVKSVNNQLKVKPLLTLGEISNDVWLTTKVKSNLLTKKELSGVKIKVYTEAKEVYLLGVVTQEQADIAVEVARNISGVKKIIKGFVYSQPKQKLAEEKKLEEEQKPAPVTDLAQTSQPEKVATSIEKVTTSSKSAEVIPYIEPVEVADYNEQDN